MARKKKQTKTSKPKTSQTLTQSAVTKEVVVKKSRWTSLLSYSILLAIPFILYAYSISFGYVLDDKLVLTENSFVTQGVSGIQDIFSNDSFTGFLGTQKNLVAGARYRPLSIATFALEYEFFGLNPKVSHFINILLYALTGLLLFKVLSLLFTEKNKWYLGIPFIATLLFLVHPLHTEVVANIKSRDEILVLLFALTALYFSYQYVVKQKKCYLIFVLITFVLALFAKENAITFSAVIPVSLYFFTKATFKKIAAVTATLLNGAVLFVVVRYQVIGYLLDSGQEITGLMNNPFLGVSASDKFATIVYTWGEYFKLLVFPHPLTHDYYPYQIAIVGWDNFQVLITVLICIITIVFAVKSFKKKSISAWAIVFFIATFSIVSNMLFSIGTFMNERFMYISSIGFVVLLSYTLLVKFPQWFKKHATLVRPITYGILALFIVGFSYKTIDRVPAWESNLTLNRAASTVSVNSARANQFMGYSLYVEATESTDRARKKELLDEATLFVDRALKIHPKYPDANNAKAGILAGQYQLDRNLQTLLDGFYEVQMRNFSPFVDTYLNYLETRADATTLTNFYKRLGTDLVKMGYTNKGTYYLRKMN